MCCFNVYKYTLHISWKLTYLQKLRFYEYLVSIYSLQMYLFQNVEYYIHLNYINDTFKITSKMP